MSLVNDFEFNMLLLNATDTPVYTFEYYDMKRVPEGIYVEFNNYGAYQYYNNDQYYIFKVLRDENVDPYDHKLDMTLTVRPEFIDFTEQRLIRDSMPYRGLFGTAMNNDIKRLIMFLYSIRHKDLAEYVNACPDEIRKEIEDYVFGCLFSKGDLLTSPLKHPIEEQTQETSTEVVDLED